MTDQKIEEAKSSFDVNAEVPEPVDTGSTARPADKHQGDLKSPSLTKAQMISGITHAAYKQTHPELTQLYREFFKLQGTNVSAEANRATIRAGGLKEDIEGLFANEQLSEGFKDQATTIFESALNAAIVVETAALEEEFEARLTEEVGVITDRLVEGLEKYLAHAADRWLEENKLAVESTIRTDISEGFLHGLKALFNEHYVSIPEDAVDVVEAMAAEVQSLSDRLNESERRAIEQQSVLEQHQRKAVVDTIAEGLADTQREMLHTLAEDVAFEGVEAFANKIRTLSESVVQKNVAVTAGAAVLNEELNLDETKQATSIDPVVAAALAAGRRVRG